MNDLVYSTDRGKMCPRCKTPVTDCLCGKIGAVPEGDGIVRIGRETKGRKGKGVTTIKGLLLKADELKQLCKQLKTKCGTGGTVKNSVIEIQGDHRETVLIELKKQGWTVKLAG